MGYTFRRDLARPLQHAELDANFDHTNLVSIARALNEPDANVGYSTAGLIVKKYIYDASTQTAWSVPTDAQGETIVSVVGSDLNTNVMTYKLTKVFLSGRVLFKGFGKMLEALDYLGRDVTFSNGMLLSTGLSDWVVTSTTTSVPLTGGLYAKVTGDLHVSDFSDDINGEDDVAAIVNQALNVGASINRMGDGQHILRSTINIKEG